MCFNSMALASKSHISKMLVLPQSPESFRIFLLVVVPTQAKVFVLHRLRPHGVVGLLYNIVSQFHKDCFVYVEDQPVPE